MTFPRYWTWDELKEFLVANDLVISEGTGDDDEMTLTGRGQELFQLLSATVRLGGGVPG
jgi:hypothetical protein